MTPTPVLLHLISESWVSATAASLAFVTALGSVLVVMVAQDPVAWSIAIAAIITSLSAAMVSVIVALKTSSKIQQTAALQADTNLKVNEVASITPAIHKAVNSNYQEMQNALVTLTAAFDAQVAENKQSKADELSAAQAKIREMEIRATVPTGTSAPPAAPEPAPDITRRLSTDEITTAVDQMRQAIEDSRKETQDAIEGAKKDTRDAIEGRDEPSR